MLALPFVPVERVQDAVGRASRLLADADSTATPDDITWSVNVLSSYLPAAVTCLRRAIVAQAMLASHGYPARVRIGVRKAGSEFRAHAWVEHEGRVLLGDLDDLSQYTPLPTDETGLRRRTVL
jgi:hypothetical protein